MNNDEMVTKITEVEQRSKSNTKRIDKLEETNEALTNLTTSVRELVIKQNYTKESIDKLDKRVSGIGTRIYNIEQKPAKRWDSIVEKIILTIIALLIGFIFAKIGVK